ncbi:hypothetical protein LB506_010597 [Fusarium annulatum]|nr:hypothetical protein LB506_010597 [Fusarium annulatum]
MIVALSSTLLPYLQPRLRETRPKTAVFFIPYVQLSIFNWVPSIWKAYSAKRLGARLYIKWDAQPMT